MNAQVELKNYILIRSQFISEKTENSNESNWNNIQDCSYQCDALNVPTAS